MSETGIVKQALVALSRLPGVRVWRQNVAKLPDIRGQWIQFGIPGMADIGGIVGPEGWRLEMEMKTKKGRQRKEQLLWQTMIELHGGIYLLARSADEAVELLETELRQRRQAK